LFQLSFVTLRGRTGRERPYVKADVNEGGPRLQAATNRAAFIAVPQQHQPPPPATRHSPHGAAPLHGEGGQSLWRTVAPRHTAGCGPRPGPAPASARPASEAPHDTSPANNNRPEGMRTSCCQQPVPPPRDAAKMSPRISIGPEPVLAAHALPPPASGSHCPAREGSAPHCGTELLWDQKECNQFCSKEELWEAATALLRVLMA
jgi:hypothetical protein